MRDVLLPGEQRLWDQLSAPDQRHGVQVARDVVEALPAASRPVLAAAVLHDVGKLVCGYGTFGRVGATLFWGAVPGAFRGRLAFGWARREGLGRFGAVRRLGEYRIHPELGRDLLAAAGSDDFTARWAGEHHTPIDRWTVDRELGLVLKECDDD
ncbi:MAG: hypothetical protein HKN24_13080 [Acidimicrobiales bacterium]|nr:hypothetical protein [Acidimicrobiales bacterium]